MNRFRQSMTLSVSAHRDSSSSSSPRKNKKDNFLVNLFRKMEEEGRQKSVHPKGREYHSEDFLDDEISSSNSSSSSEEQGSRDDVPREIVKRTRKSFSLGETLLMFEETGRANRDKGGRTKNKPKRKSDGSQKQRHSAPGVKRRSSFADIMQQMEQDGRKMMKQKKKW